MRSRVADGGYRPENMLGREVDHALEMAEWAFTLETRAARQIERQNAGSRRERRGKDRTARSIKRHERFAQRCSDMHETGIVAHEEGRRGEYIDRTAERR